MQKNDYNVFDQIGDIAEQTLNEMRDVTVSRAKDYWMTNILGMPSEQKQPEAAPTVATQAQSILQGNALYIIAGLVGLLIISLFARK